MNIETRLKAWNKKTISLSELESLLHTGSDAELCSLVSDAVSSGFLSPVKASGTNENRIYPLFLKYRISVIAISQTTNSLFIQRRLKPRQQESASLRISQIDTDLKEFLKTKDDLVHQCVIQGKQMYEGLMQLANNSKVSVQGRRRQMLRFDIPDAVNENVVKANISAEIDKGTDEIVAGMADGACSESDIRKTASGTVGSRRLLRRYINADNIVLKAFKIDRNPDNSGYRTREQTQVNNSGAEKFVVYFAVILALMAYTRDNCDDMGGKNKSALVLDNPFGPISSKHVLEPMFEQNAVIIMGHIYDGLKAQG